jgi:hypothetical protein
LGKPEKGRVWRREEFRLCTKNRQRRQHTYDGDQGGPEQDDAGAAGDKPQRRCAPGEWRGRGWMRLRKHPRHNALLLLQADYHIWNIEDWRDSQCRPLGAMCSLSDSKIGLSIFTFVSGNGWVSYNSCACMCTKSSTTAMIASPPRVRVRVFSCSEQSGLYASPQSIRSARVASNMFAHVLQLEEYDGPKLRRTCLVCGHARVNEAVIASQSQSKCIAQHDVEVLHQEAVRPPECAAAMTFNSCRSTHLPPLPIAIVDI